MQEIKGEDYIVNYDPENVKVDFQGELALSGLKEYEPIKDLLNEILASKPSTITLNLRELTFLNSSGISLLSKFVLEVRKLHKKQEIQLVILGSNDDDVAWQKKSLKNLEKLLPSITLDME